MARENCELKNLMDYDMESLLIEVRQGCRLICFGAGKALGIFLDKMAEYAPEEYVYAIADNDLNKQGNVYEARGKEIPIKSPKELFDSGGVELPIIVLITSRNLMGIYAELGNYSRLMNTRVAFYGYIIDHLVEKNIRDGRYGCHIVHEDGIQIPKVIHYCWFGKNPIPDRYKAWMKSWKKFCPDYEIVEWNESNYDVNKNVYMAEAYEAKKWGFVPDYARLDIIYENGGIYLDTDVELIQNLDTLLQQTAYCGFEDDKYVNLGLGFGAVAHNECILAMRDDYVSKRFKNADGHLNLMASPKYQTQVLATKGLKMDGSFQKIGKMIVYPREFFSPMNLYNRQILRTQNTFSIHHFDGSWLEKEDKEAQKNLKRIYNSTFPLKTP